MFCKFFVSSRFLCNKSAEFSAETGAEEVFPKLLRVTEWESLSVSQLSLKFVTVCPELSCFFDFDDFIPEDELYSVESCAFVFCKFRKLMIFSEG